MIPPKSKSKNLIFLEEDNEEYKKIKEEMKGYRKYHTHYAGWRPYLCYIKNNEIFIYKKDSKYYISQKNDIDDWTYTKLVKHYKTDRIFIGKINGKKNNFSPNFIKKTKGNSILLKLNRNKYVFIGDMIYSFDTNDDITKYFSFIENNSPVDSPDPVAIGEDNIYFMIERKYIPRKFFLEDTMKINDLEDIHNYKWFAPWEYKFFDFKGIKIIDEEKFSNFT